MNQILLKNKLTIAVIIRAVYLLVRNQLKEMGIIKMKILMSYSMLREETNRSLNLLSKHRIQTVIITQGTQRSLVYHIILRVKVYYLERFSISRSVV